VMYSGCGLGGSELQLEATAATEARPVASKSLAFINLTPVTVALIVF
jgi:hypothetical protein